MIKTGEKSGISILSEGTNFNFYTNICRLISVSISQVNFDTTALRPRAADRQIDAGKVVRLLQRTQMKIVFVGTVIFVPIFHYVLLSRSEKDNLNVSGYTKARSRGTGGIKTAIIQRTTTRLNKPQATELRAKFFIAFAFGDQLSRATESLLALATLARYGNRSVAVPFVKDSKFHGTKIDQDTGTLSRYFDLNEPKTPFLRLWIVKGMGAFHFQQRCNQSLDVLLNALTLEGDNASNARLSDSQRQLLKKTGWTPCFLGVQQTGDRFKGFIINQTICFDPEIVTSVQQ